MNAPINHNELALQRSLTDVVAEYDTKAAALDGAISTFEKAGTALHHSKTTRFTDACAHDNEGSPLKGPSGLH